MCMNICRGVMRTLHWISPMNEVLRFPVIFHFLKGTMTMKKLLSICLIVCFMLSFAMPVMAAEGENVALGAEITLIGFKAEANDISNVLVDGLYGTDETTWNHESNWNAKHEAFVNRYNADGDVTVLDDYKTPPYVEGYPYYSLIILELKDKADVNTFRMVATDPDYGAGEFRLQEFDILVSATGEAGTWKVVHEARDTRNNDSWVYVDEGDDLIYPYWVYEADLGANEDIKYVSIGVTMLCNHDNLTNGQFVNLLELEVFAAAEAAETEPTETEPTETEPTETEPTETEPTETEPTETEPTETEPTETEAPETFDFVIVPVAALAVAAAGAVVLKKKEN